LEWVWDAEKQAAFEALLALPDEEINTEDIPEMGDWSEGVRGMFSRSVGQQGPLYDVTAKENPVIQFMHRYIEQIFLVIAGLAGVLYFVVAFLLTGSLSLLIIGEPAAVLISSIAGFGYYCNHKK